MKSSGYKIRNQNSNTSMYFKRTWQLYLMLLLPIAYFLLFKYLPILNARIAFMDYNMFKGVAGSTWNDFAHFKEAFSQPKFYLAVRNTLMLNVLDLIVGFPIPIIVALLLNELLSDRIKKITQTVIYIPHFLSWVIVAGIAFQVFSSSGLFNTLLKYLFDMESVKFLTVKENWLIVYLAVGVWHSAGYGTIIYLAALTSIDPTLYEAAYVDGAGRFKRMIHITLPCIKSTVVILLILQVGKLMSISFDRPYMLGNALVAEYSDVISTYVHTVGISNARYDYASAVGLFQSVIAFVILITFNFIVKKLGEEGIM